MSTRSMIELVMPLALGASTAAGLVAAGVAPALSAVSAAVAALWLLLVLSLPERGDA